MSARAIRKLREDREAALAAAAEDDDESGSEEDLPAIRDTKPVASAFALMNGGGNSSDDDSSASSGDGSNEIEREGGEDDEDDEQGNIASPEESKAVVEGGGEEKQEENLDDLLEEFKDQDDKNQSATGGKENDPDAPDYLEDSSCFRQLLTGIEVKDLDVDHVMRTSLATAEPAADGGASSNNTKGKRRNRQTFLFGNPRDLNVNVKPPHYVGGGIGMTTYDRESETERTIPWPYAGMDRSGDEISDGMMAAWQDRRRWFTFIYSDSYEKDYQDFRRIQESGDLNALVLFVAHHPFVTEALVNLGMMLYHANQAQDGLSFLRRSLWVYESASLSSFAARVFEGRSFFMDYEQKENQTYFDALFKLARVNNMAGLSRSSFAIGRYLLSLDPLRDPSGILLALDHYALASNVDKNDQWLIDLVESKNIRVYYHDESTGIDYQCELYDLPNFAYSIALALFRLNDSRPDDKSNEAIRTAISLFPSVVDLLLNENDIDISSRSCRMDWQTVIEYTGSRANAIHAASDEMDPVVRMATDKSFDLVTRIFAKLNHKLWASDGVMLWLHSNLEQLKNSDTSGEVKPLSPAMMRYCRLDPGDYEMKFQLLPAEANPLDPGLVQHALVIDPNRRRFLRNQRGGQRVDGNEDGLFLFGQAGNAGF